MAAPGLQGEQNGLQLIFLRIEGSAKECFGHPPPFQTYRRKKGRSFPLPGRRKNSPGVVPRHSRISVSVAMEGDVWLRSSWEMNLGEFGPVGKLFLCQAILQAQALDFYQCPWNIFLSWDRCILLNFMFSVTKRKHIYLSKTTAKVNIFFQKSTFFRRLKTAVFPGNQGKKRGLRFLKLQLSCIKSL